MTVSDARPPALTRQEFLESVLRSEPRVAAFDCDGTLWSSDAGETFFDWEIRNGVVSAEVGRAMRARYADYRAGKVREETMCGEMVTMHDGLPEAVMKQAASEFMQNHFPGRIFAEMHELVQRLHDSGCEVWAVSASNEWVIRAGIEPFGISVDRILASKVAIDGGVVTDRLIRVPSGPGKTKALREVARKHVDSAFGNSRFDADMLDLATHSFAVNPNPDLEATARQRGWSVYFPEATRT